jgi:hypothetical protein
LTVCVTVTEQFPIVSVSVIVCDPVALQAMSTVLFVLAPTIDPPPVTLHWYALPLAGVR